MSIITEIINFNDINKRMLEMVPFLPDHMKKEVRLLAKQYTILEMKNIHPLSNEVEITYSHPEESWKFRVTMTERGITLCEQLIEFSCYE